MGYVKLHSKLLLYFFEFVSQKLSKNKIGLLWCHSHVDLRLIEVDVDRS